jgi:hypothetical protein
MIFTIANGVTKDILVGDFVVTNQNYSPTTMSAAGCLVTGFDDNGVDLQVVLLDRVTHTNLSASQVLAVWRPV